MKRWVAVTALLLAYGRIGAVVLAQSNQAQIDKYDQCCIDYNVP